MSITLDSNLQTAQDGQTHNPIIEIISAGLIDDIPFDGQYLTTETTNEQRPNLIFHSTGRLVSVYTYGTGTVKFVTTDTARTEFNFISLTNTALGAPSETIIEASLCEMTDANIGIVFITSISGDYKLRRAIVNIDGEVQSSALINDYSTQELKSPFVITLADNSYMLVYIVNLTATTSTIYKRTSSNFTSWSAESSITPSGISTNIKDNVSLCQIDNDDIFLLFDYYDDTNYSNCYYSISEDNGSTWGAAVAITSYDSADATGLHPIAYQKETDELNIVYYEQRTALWMDDDTDGMPEVGESGLTIGDITIDPDTSRAYIVISHLWVGIKRFYAVIEIDIVTWEVLDYWDTETTPAFDEIFTEHHVWSQCNTGFKHLIPIAITRSDSYRHIAVLDAQEDTITHYNFSEGEGETLSKNIIWTSWGRYGTSTSYSIAQTLIDSSSRLWVFQYADNVYGSSIDIGYIDLTEEPVEIEGEDYYNFYQMVRDHDVEQSEAKSTKFMYIDETNNYAYVCFTGLIGYPGCLKVYDLTKETTYIDRPYFPESLDTALIDIDYGLCIGEFTWTRGYGFPRKGIKRMLVYDDKIYGIFTYEEDYDEGHKRGLCEIVTERKGDALTIKEVNFYRPTWGSYDDYLFWDLKLTSENKILLSSTYGITLFDPESKEWELFDNNNYPGLTSDDEERFVTLGYDSSTNMVLSGRAGVTSINDLVAFSLDGPMKKTYYKEGSYSESWTFGGATEMIQAYNDYEAVIAVNPSDSSLYIFWTNQLLEELSIKWDHDAGEFDLTPYLLRSVEVVLKRSIENKPGELTFAVSCGHLFDPYNSNSLISSYLTKDRRITVRIGETVSDTEYWQNQGTFLVKSYKMSGYERGQYPTGSVICKDIMSLWSDNKVITTEFYETDAESVMVDILENKADMDSEDIDDFEFDNTADIYVQWLDADVMTIMSEICDRFGHFIIIDMDNQVTCRKISDENDIDHTYSDKDDFIRWTPNDDYSDSVNRIIAVGEERDFNEIVYSEEMVVTKAGTSGWWSGGERISCFYSEDKTRRCLYPRLEWITQPTGLGLWEDHLSAYIEEHDDQLGCDLVIDAPNLVGRLLVLLGLIGTKWAIPDGVSGGSTIPIGRLAEGALLTAIMDILSAVTNWQGTIYARPTGMVRRSIQAIANDTSHQNKINKIIPETIEEPMCYTSTQCQEVADYELMLKQLQRRRAELTKIMHLQDETGDTIRALHPFSNQTIDFFITMLTRRYKMPNKPGTNDGYCLDDIEAWILSK